MRPIGNRQVHADSDSGVRKCK